MPPHLVPGGGEQRGLGAGDGVLASSLTVGVVNLQDAH
jgi:hypothetical protein